GPDLRLPEGSGVAPAARVGPRRVARERHRHRRHRRAERPALRGRIRAPQDPGRRRRPRARGVSGGRPRGGAPCRARPAHRSRPRAAGRPRILVPGGRSRGRRRTGPAGYSGNRPRTLTVPRLLCRAASRRPFSFFSAGTAVVPFGPMKGDSMRRLIVPAVLAVLTLGWSAACGSGPAPEAPPAEPTEEQIVATARGIHERVITLDTHDDINP